MTRKEHDIVVLSQICCGMHVGSTVKHSRKIKERQATRTTYYLYGHVICREFFSYVHNMGQDKLNALIAHFKAAGIEARQHKSSKRAPKHALSFEDTKAVVDFIVNFAEFHAIVLPGRQPGHWNTNVKLLFTNVTKKKVYDGYCASATVSDRRIVSRQTFNRLWKQLTPFVTTMRPATDLCWFCQKNSGHLLRTANLPDAEKGQAVLEKQDHLEKASKERSYYQQVCEAAKNSLPAGTTLGQEDRRSFSVDGMSRYSFDFAPQVHYSSNPLQPGPIFFKTPRKRGLFGVACEAIPCQVNFLLEECVSAGKGTNCVVSLLHYFFLIYGLGENHVHLHADDPTAVDKIKITA
ncbi:uncharacterized protein LOC118477524 [Aplysia californica]|uniref:Uncharacterized protein LOC118477524 n=1 Tax=Aplysia californica TaxID=6500 RepID=A0ABM1VRN7_APLCA|nr:uncharacterized protein LOC118477524 [Aplysia californica]